VVAVLKEGVEIGTVREPGAVFGEISALLDSLTRRTYVRSRRRNFTSLTPPIELRRQVQAGRPPRVIEKTADEMEELLGASSADLGYARYPYDLFASDRSSR
jgi:hypothetical protein